MGYWEIELQLSKTVKFFSKMNGNQEEYSNSRKYYIVHMFLTYPLPRATHWEDYSIVPNSLPCTGGSGVISFEHFNINPSWKIDLFSLKCYESSMPYIIATEK